MTNEAFQKGLLMLTATFQGYKFNPNLLWQTLNDLDGTSFLKAVVEIVKTTKDLYPGSNVIAMIREKAEKIVTEEQQVNILKITAESEQERVERWKNEAVPMPEDCRIALANMGIKLGEIK